MALRDAAPVLGTAWSNVRVGAAVACQQPLVGAGKGAPRSQLALQQCQEEAGWGGLALAAAGGGAAEAV